MTCFYFESPNRRWPCYCSDLKWKRSSPVGRSAASGAARGAAPVRSAFTHRKSARIRTPTRSPRSLTQPRTEAFCFILWDWKHFRGLLFGPAIKRGSVFTHFLKSALPLSSAPRLQKCWVCLRRTGGSTPGFGTGGDTCSRGLPTHTEGERLGVERGGGIPWWMPWCYVRSWVTTFCDEEDVS